MIAQWTKIGFCIPTKNMISDHAKSWALSDDWLIKLKWRSLKHTAAYSHRDRWTGQKYIFMQVCNSISGTHAVLRYESVYHIENAIVEQISGFPLHKFQGFTSSLFLTVPIWSFASKLLPWMHFFFFIGWHKSIKCFSEKDTQKSVD